MIKSTFQVKSSSIALQCLFLSFTPKGQQRPVSSTGTYSTCDEIQMKTDLFMIKNHLGTKSIFFYHYIH